ncbi:aminopeptidase N [Streptococcus acidominimus]|uniref:Aminopeptidase n=1 Tax=Streptococcus acidominimus TaxID=1326 RepID=A0A239X1D2_STRAI|nr:M1 family metallopeptidase [Streptococcus acidominimus]SNV40497.1 aminopeptidase N [Streptococcus acidominimus]
MKVVEHLIETFIPENYNLFLDLNRDEKIFSGNVAISGEALDNQMALHQKDLHIESVKLDNEPLVFDIDNDNECVRIDLPETGIMTLVIEFSGKITDNMTGIYPSYYTENGVKKEIISTQFESHFAREAFPCIDEPEAKATFDLSLKFDQKDGELALSNMPEANPELRQETGVWSFETTPRMSSYLLAFGFGDLQGKTQTSKNGTEVGIFSTKAHSLKSLDFALDIAVRVIDFYEEYFGVAYPIPLSYHLALPDFSAGAMENWGLITYREIYLLVDENSTVASRQQVALVVAHELAHQWFGNLVTMKWWDDLWLNESFANMMEYVAIDAIEPDWHIFEDFQTSGVPHALKRDATDGVQSVHVQVNHPDEINTLFDAAIVYAKGSRLMHMLRRWLGDEAFASGLGAYFKKHQYQNTVGYDLWRALSDASDRDVASFMDSWLEQPGYPVVSVEVVDDQLVIRQEQFFIGQGEDAGRLWQIPLNSNWSGLPDMLTEAQVVIPGYAELTSQNQGALRLNTENTAHYITHYKGDVLESVLLELEALDAISQLQVAEERRLLAEGGRITFADLIPLLRRLAKTNAYVVIAAISAILETLDKFIDEGSEEEAAKDLLVREIFHEHYQRLGFLPNEGESDEDEMIRQIVLAHLIEAKDPEVMMEANRLFEHYHSNLEAIPAAIRTSLLVNAFKTSESDDLLAEYTDYYVKTNDGTFKRQLTQAMAYTKSEEHLEAILSYLQNKDIVKPQDLSSWYAALLKHDFAQETVWNWSKNHWDWIKSALGGDMSFDAFVIIPSRIFKTPQALEEYKAFFEPQLSDMALSRNIAMGIKEITARIDLIAKEKAAISITLLEHRF